MKKKLLLLLVVVAFAVLSIGLLTACPSTTITTTPPPPQLSSYSTAFINAVDALPAQNVLVYPRDAAAVASAEGLWPSVPQQERTYASVVTARTTLNDLNTRINALRQDAAAAALQVAIDDAVGRFETAFAYRFTQSHFSLANWTTLTGRKATQISAIEAFTTVEAAVSFDADAFNWIAFTGDVLTIAQEADALSNAIVAAVERFETAFAYRFIQDDFRPADWTVLIGRFNAQVEAIEALTTVVAANGFDADAFNWIAFRGDILTEYQHNTNAARATLEAGFNTEVAALLASDSFLAKLTAMFGATTGVAGTPVYELIAYINSSADIFRIRIATMTLAEASAIVVATEVATLQTAAFVASNVRLEAEIALAVLALNNWFNSVFTIENDIGTYFYYNGTYYEVVSAQWIGAYSLRNTTIVSLNAKTTFVALDSFVLADIIAQITELALIDPELAIAHNEQNAALRLEFVSRFNQADFTTAEWTILENMLDESEAAIRAIRPRNATETLPEVTVAEAIAAVRGLDFSDATDIADWVNVFGAVPTIATRLAGYLAAVTGDANIIAIDVLSRDEAIVAIAARNELLVTLNDFIALIYDYNVELTLAQDVLVLWANMQVLAYWTATNADFTARLNKINDLSQVATGADLLNLNGMRGDLVNRIMLRIAYNAANYITVDGINNAVASLSATIIPAEALLTIIATAMQEPAFGVNIADLAQIENLIALHRVLYSINALNTNAQSLAQIENVLDIEIAATEHMTAIYASWRDQYHRLNVVLARHVALTTLQGYIVAINNVTVANDADWAQVEVLLANIDRITALLAVPANTIILSIQDQIIILAASNQALAWWLDEVTLDAFEAQITELNRLTALASGNLVLEQQINTLRVDLVNRLVASADALVELDVVANIDAIGYIVEVIEDAIHGLDTSFGFWHDNLPLARIGQLADLAVVVPVIEINREILAMVIADANNDPVEATRMQGIINDAFDMYYALSPGQRIDVTNSIVIDLGTRTFIPTIAALVQGLNTIRFEAFVASVTELGQLVELDNFMLVLNNEFDSIQTAFNSKAVDDRIALQPELNRAIGYMQAVITAVVNSLYGPFGRIGHFEGAGLNRVTNVNMHLINAVRADIEAYDSSVNWDNVNLELFRNADLRGRIVTVRDNYEALQVALGQFEYDDWGIPSFANTQNFNRIEAVDYSYRVAVLLIPMLDRVGEVHAQYLEDQDPALDQYAFTPYNWNIVSNLIPSRVFAQVVANILDINHPRGIAGAYYERRADIIEEGSVASLRTIVSVQVGAIEVMAVWTAGTDSIFNTQITANAIRFGAAPPPGDAIIAQAATAGSFFGALRNTGEYGADDNPIATATAPAIDTPQSSFIAEHLEIAYYRARFDTVSMAPGVWEREYIETEPGVYVPNIRRLYWQFARYAYDEVNNDLQRAYRSVYTRVYEDIFDNDIGDYVQVFVRYAFSHFDTSTPIGHYAPDGSGIIAPRETHGGVDTPSPQNVPQVKGNIRLGSSVFLPGIAAANARNRVGWFILTRDANTTLQISPYTGAVKHSNDGGITWSDWVSQSQAVNMPGVGSMNDGAAITAADARGQNRATAHWIRPGEVASIGYHGQSIHNYARGLSNPRLAAAAFLNEVWTPAERNNNAYDRFAINARIIATQAANLRPSAWSGQVYSTGPIAQWGGATHQYEHNEIAMHNAIAALGTADNRFANIVYTNAATAAASLVLIEAAEAAKYTVQVTNASPAIIARNQDSFDAIVAARVRFEQLEAQMVASFLTNALTLDEANAIDEFNVEAKTTRVMETERAFGAPFEDPAVFADLLLSTINSSRALVQAGAAVADRWSDYATFSQAITAAVAAVEMAWSRILGAAGPEEPYVAAFNTVIARLLTYSYRPNASLAAVDYVRSEVLRDAPNALQTLMGHLERLLETDPDFNQADFNRTINRIQPQIDLINDNIAWFNHTGRYALGGDLHEYRFIRMQLSDGAPLAGDALPTGTNMTFHTRQLAGTTFNSIPVNEILTGSPTASQATVDRVNSLWRLRLFVFTDVTVTREQISVGATDLFHSVPSTQSPAHLEFANNLLNYATFYIDIRMSLGNVEGFYRYDTNNNGGIQMVAEAMRVAMVKNIGFTSNLLDRVIAPGAPGLGAATNAFAAQLVPVDSSLMEPSAPRFLGRAPMRGTNAAGTADANVTWGGWNTIRTSTGAVHVRNMLAGALGQFLPEHTLDFDTLERDDWLNLMPDPIANANEVSIDSIKYIRLNQLREEIVHMATRATATIRGRADFVDYLPKLVAWEARLGEIDALIAQLS